MLNTKEFNDIIKRESRVTVIISLVFLFTVGLYFILSVYAFSKINIKMDKKSVDNLFQILNVIAIVEIIIILAVRKTIYFSEKIIKKEMNLSQILNKWRSIDIILLAIGESISIYGLVLVIMGMPIGRTFHFFVASALVILIIMPMNWKVRDKIRTLQRYREVEL